MPTKRKYNKWFVLAVLSIALFMINLDITIVNIALPAIMDDFKASLADIEWVVNVYILGFAVTLITLGRLGDIFGRKRLFIIGLIVFTISSFFCGVSQSIEMLIISRVFQALGGAAMMPTTLALINVAFKDGGRGQAMGIWGAVSGAASALGPIVGGLLVHHLSWGYIFLVNIPLGIIAIILGLIIIEESKEHLVSRYIDFPGIIAATVALFSLTFALIEGQKFGWSSPLIISLFIVSLLGFAAFILIEKRSKLPLIDLKLFTNRSFSAGNVLNALLMFSLMGILFLLVLFLEIVLGFSAIKTGLVILPMPLAVLLIAPFAGKFADKKTSRWILATGMAIIGISIFLLSHLSLDTTWQSLIFPLTLSGIGMGLVMAPVSTVIMAAAPLEKSGAASGIMSTTRQIGSFLGIGVLGAVLQTHLIGYVKTALNNSAILTEEMKNIIINTMGKGGFSSGVDLSGIPEEFQAEIMRMFFSGFAESLNTAMQVAVLFCIIGIISAFLISNKSNEVKKT
ncbi:MAG: MFS transporter [Dehalococcoidales bacterium]